MECDVLIGLDGATTAALVASTQAIPMPIRCRGLIDTGTDVTCVNAVVLRQLGLRHPKKTATTQGATGSATVDLYKVSASIQDFHQPQGPKLVFADLLVMELPTVLPGLDVLIGMDVLLTARFVLEGPQRQLALEF